MCPCAATKFVWLTNIGGSTKTTSYEKRASIATNASDSGDIRVGLRERRARRGLQATFRLSAHSTPTSEAAGVIGSPEIVRKKKKIKERAALAELLLHEDGYLYRGNIYVHDLKLTR